MANLVRLIFVCLSLFTTICSSHRKAPIQLAFGVMTYEREGQSVNETINDFMRLMNQIYEDEHNHVYILHTDYKSSSILLRHVDNYCTTKPNCLSIFSRSVTWGGISVTEMNLALMQAADDFIYSDGRSSSWEYFFLLGHESMPLTKLTYTEQFLMSYPKGTNFINCWKSEGYDFFGQWESVIHRLSRVVVDSTVENILYEPDIDRDVPHGIKIFKSLQYVVLSRDFVRFSCHGEHTRRILLFLANVKASDELLFPTLLQINATLAATATCDTTLHFTHWIRPGGSWHPEYLTLEHLPLLLNTSSHLFARKVNGEYSSELLEALDRIRSEHYNFLPGAKNSEITQNIDDSTMISLDPKIIKIEMTTPVTVSMEIDNGNLVRRDRSFDQLIGVHPFHSALPLLQQKELFETDFYWLIPIGVRYLKRLWEDESTDIRIIDAILNHALEIESKYNFEKDLESLRIIEAFKGNILFTNHTDENINNSNNNNSKKTDKVNSKVVLPLPDVEGNFNTNNILISKLDEPASKGTFNFISAVFESNSDSGRRGDGDKKGNYFYKSAYDLLMTLDAARRVRDQIETDLFIQYLTEHNQWPSEKF